MYACTREGLQIFDPTGRLSGVLLSPRRASVTAVTFGEKDHDRIYVVCDRQLYVRKLNARGVLAEKK